MKQKIVARLFGIILFLVLAGFYFMGNVFAQSLEEHVNRGQTYYKQGYHDQAISEYSKALEIDPGNDVAYFNRGLAYRDRGWANKSTYDADMAIADFNKVIEMYPNYHRISAVYVARGNVYSDKRNLDSAIYDYDRAISIDPNNALAYENRGLAYCKKDNFNQAISDYSKAIKLNPSKASLYLERGTIYFMKRDSDDLALSDLNKTIQLNPNAGGAYANRAEIYFDKKQYDKCWDDVHKAEALGYKVIPYLIEDLKKVTGRER